MAKVGSIASYVLMTVQTIYQGAASEAGVAVAMCR
jgi:hypothetical protein